MGRHLVTLTWKRCAFLSDLSKFPPGTIRNVIQDQHQQIALLERQIMQMRQRREWGDASSHEDGGGVNTPMEVSTSSTASSESSSTSSSIGDGKPAQPSESSISSSGSSSKWILVNKHSFEHAVVCCQVLPRTKSFLLALLASLTLFSLKISLGLTVSVSLRLAHSLARSRQG